MPTAGLVADWRADALSGFVDGDPVTVWAPSVGVGALTGAAVFRAAASPLGGPAVEFDGATHQLTRASTAGLPIGAAAGTVVAIVCRARPVGGAGIQHIVHYGYADDRRTRGLALTSVGLIRTHEWSSGLFATAAPTGWGVRVLGHGYDGSVVTLLVDGVDCVSGEAALDTGSVELAFGSRIAGPAERGACRVLRVSFYDRVLVRADWAQVMTHARLAYGALGG
jgi:hypothetical protein